MELLIDNIWIVVIGLCIGSAIYYYVTNNKRKARAWLLRAVIEAEKEFGAGTGTLKLVDVYERFVQVLPKAADIISFEEFSQMVDKALDKMRHLQETNPAIANYISGN